jgi:lipopolysaccharide export system permease protein
VVIPTLKMKNDLSRLLLHQQRTEDNSDIVIKARTGQIIYAVDFFDIRGNILNGLNIIEQDEEGNFISLIRSTQASWSGEYWKLKNPIIYEWSGGLLRARQLGETDAYREQPDAFRRSAVNVEELPARDAQLLVGDLRAAGLPYTNVLADFYHRFSFPTASLVVMILSISMGGRFRKNILLMSLLASLVAAVIFYVTEMITMMMARLGYIPPIVGEWFPVLIFIIIGLLLLRGAKT